MDATPATSLSDGAPLAFHPGSCSESLVTRTVLVVDHVGTGEAIRKRRESVKLSLRKLAAECGWSAPYQSDLELGRRTWSDEKCLKVEYAIKKLSSQKS